MKLQIGIDEKTYEVEVEVLEDDDVPRRLSYGVSDPADLTAHSLVPATIHSVQAPSAQARASEAVESGDEDKLCRSPVTGLVVKVNVEPGQQIETNELIMVLEAMKMEANVTTPHAGKVKSVKVAPGDAVKVNQVVVVLE